MDSGLSQLTGREHWLQLNKQWREKGSNTESNAPPRVPRKPLNPQSYNYVYKMLVVERCSLKDPLPLADAIPMLVYGWKKAGIWPTDLPAAKYTIDIVTMPANVIDSGPIVCLEFFSGIGGLHYGLQQSGAPGKVAMAFDTNEIANTVYEHNFGYRPSNKSIDYLEPHDIDRHKANCWLLSPPCQPYTRGGKYLDDQDNRARGLIHLLKLLPRVKYTPDYVLLENVMNFENSRSRSLLVSTLGHLGFVVREFLISPTQIGIPNSRLRYFLVARRQWPRPLSSNESEEYLAWVAANKQRTDNYIQRGRDALFTQWPVDLAAGGVPADIAPLASYIDTTYDSSLLVPEAYILKRRNLEFDIVRATSPSTSTFTKAYGSKHLIGSGSLLQTKRLEIVENGFKSPERLLDLGLRFFSPKEVALLHHFPYVESKGGDHQTETTKHLLSFPPAITQKQRLQLLGNSLNVQVVAELLKQVLFSDTIR